jgi:hypothetical protein
MDGTEEEEEGGSTVGQTFPTDPFIVAHQQLML